MTNTLSKALATPSAKPGSLAKPVSTHVSVAKPTGALAKPGVATKASGAVTAKKGGKKMYGGDASNWVGQNFGYTAASQYDNTFSNTGLGNSGNLIPTVKGAPAVGQYNKPQGSLKMNGGRRRSRGKRGGNLGQVLSTAAVPFGLWGAQYMYSRRRNRALGSKTMRLGRSRRARSYRRYSGM
jgi:hypothetical protein